MSSGRRGNVAGIHIRSFFQSLRLHQEPVETPPRIKESREDVSPTPQAVAVLQPAVPDTTKWLSRDAIKFRRYRASQRVLTMADMRERLRGALRKEKVKAGDPIAPLFEIGGEACVHVSELFEEHIEDLGEILQETKDSIDAGADELRKEIDKVLAKIDALDGSAQERADKKVADYVSTTEGMLRTLLYRYFDAKRLKSNAMTMLMFFGILLGVTAVEDFHGRANFGDAFELRENPYQAAAEKNGLSAAKQWLVFMINNNLSSAPHTCQMANTSEGPQKSCTYTLVVGHVP
ncbi:MAG: hypothetical protein ACRYG8_22450 [Janthinobacterium lividum]